jgi:hypothetical protein
MSNISFGRELEPIGERARITPIGKHLRTFPSRSSHPILTQDTRVRCRRFRNACVSCI